MSQILKKKLKTLAKRLQGPLQAFIASFVTHQEGPTTVPVQIAIIIELGR